MAAILASHSCCYCCKEVIDHGRLKENLSFSGSISRQNLWKHERQLNYPRKTKETHLFHVVMQQTESRAKLGRYGKPIKMVPASDVKKRKSQSVSNRDMINGSKGAVNGASIKMEVVNGSSVINGVSKINGASLVKRDPTMAIVQTQKVDKLPPVEDLKVLPSDEGFSWASESYNSVQRTIDVWSFVLSLRVRVLLDNAKWAYLGGFTEDKQVNARI